jgi:hypothetical protein
MSTEFVKQTMRENLTRVLVPHVADGLWSIYENAKTVCDRNGQPEKTLQTFQNLLTSVPKWSEDTLEKEVDRISIASKCEYIEDLLLGVFVSYIRAFASLQQTDATHVNIEFDRPSLSKFIQALYTASARKCWSQAFMFNTINVPSTQQARNRRDIETMLESTVGEVIDSFIPWREISKAYFHVQQGTPTPSRTATVPPPVTFGEKKVHEFDTDDEDSEDEERPKLVMGEEVALPQEDDDEDDDDAASVNTEDEILQRAAGETVALNL